MSGKEHISLNHQISEEAAQWLVEFRTDDIDAAGRRAFDAWVRASPEHLRAFIEMAAIWNESGAIDAQHRLDTEAIIARARSEPQVIALTAAAAHEERIPPPAAGQKTCAAASQPTLQWKGRRPRVSRLASLAATVLLPVAAALTLVSVFEPSGIPTYDTRVGERQSVRLPDGSRVVLDSRSRIRVAFTAKTREVQLLEGQALFYVVKNPGRPFFVRAGDAVVRDVGTQFDVNRRREGTVVTVVEGVVSVTPGATTLPAGLGEGTPMPRHFFLDGKGGATSQWPTRMGPVLLSAGEQVSVAPGSFRITPVHVNVNMVTAWTDGQVVLDSATLAQVAEVFNRYSTRKLIARDHGVPPLHLSGVFATNPDFLIRYLRDRPDIVVTETDSEIDIVRNPTQ